MATTATTELDPATAMRDLMQTATTHANLTRGHLLRPFRRTSKTTASSQCTICFMDVHLNTHPAPNDVNASGTALALDCPGPTSPVERAGRTRCPICGQLSVVLVEYADGRQSRTCGDTYWGRYAYVKTRQLMIRNGTLLETYRTYLRQHHLPLPEPTV